MGDNSSCKVAGIGSVQIKMFDGAVRTLTDVRHIPNLKRNLISLSTLDSKRYKYTGEGGVLKVSKVSLVVMKGDMKAANLYHLRGSTVAGKATTVHRFNRKQVHKWISVYGWWGSSILEILQANLHSSFNNGI
ncbi:hypothetical protein LINPERPRIM_LOCUS29103 [Linum perenne]